jgi:3-phosphoglycerate kinase
MAFTKKTIRDIDIRGKTVLIREDFNVELNEHNVVTDDYRLRQALPTIEYAHGLGAKVVILAHRGRPEGRPNPNLSLLPIATKLSDLLHLPVKFASSCIDAPAQNVVKSLRPGDIAMLENLRFKSGEETNDSQFAKTLASLGEIFVQDGFGVAYRQHSSCEAITHFLPSVAGLLLEKEVRLISAVVEEPVRPLAVVIGGQSLADKIELIDKYIDKADFLALTGAVANAFLQADGVNIGGSIIDSSQAKAVTELLAKAYDKMQTSAFNFYLPHDAVVAAKAERSVKTRIVDISAHSWADVVAYPKLPPRNLYTVSVGEQILDIGPISAAHISGALKIAGSVIINGVAGVVEIQGFYGSADPFAHGTEALLEALIGEQAGEPKAQTVIAGADTVAYVESLPHIRDRLSFLTTGGGASLEMVLGHKLPGVESLLDKDVPKEVATKE